MNMALPRPLLAAAAALVLLFDGGSAHAQSAEKTISYTVRRGDTLISLATKYLLRKEDYLTVQKLNGIHDPYHVPTGSTLIVPESLLRIEPSFGEISSFRGDVAVDGSPAEQRMQIRQGMRIETSANAFVTVQFADGSAISLPSQSRVRVDRLRRIPLTDSVDRVFRLQEGRARSTVTPIRNPASNFQVTTPLSVSAVRGTDFRVGFDPVANRSLTEVVGGTVGVAPDEDKDAVAVPHGYGVVGTPDGIQPPTKLLPGPDLASLARSDDDAVLVTAKPVEGAAKYRTQLASDLRFRDIIADMVTEKPEATFPGLGSVPFFVRLTAIADTGLEGLPATYAAGRRVDPPSSDSNAAPPRETAAEGSTATSGNDQTRPGSSSSQPPLR